MHPLSPAQRVRRWNAYLWVWRVHRWLALSLGLVIVLLSLTGSILVVHESIERRFAPERHVVPVPAHPTRAPLVPVLQALQTQAPAGFRLIRVEPGHGVERSDKVIFSGPDRTTRWSAFVNPYTGEVLWRGFDQSLLTPWLLHLHMHLQAGRWGYVITGIAGLALTLLSLTGVWITRDRLGALLRHPFRFRFGSRIAAADLHKWIGIASLYFTFVLGATGLWFAILIVPRQFQPAASRPESAFDLSRLAPLEPAISTALAHFPGAELTRITLPATPHARLQVRVLHRDAPIWAKTSRIDFDAETGAIVKIARATDASAAEKWRSILAPLHFGFYGSPVVKWLYFIGGLAPAALAVTGTAIWWLRRRNTAARTRIPA